MTVSHLGVVPDEPEPVNAGLGMSIHGAASRGTRRDILVALRDRIAADLDGGVPARDLASLSKRLMEIAEELEKLEAEGGGAVGEAAETPDSTWEPI